MTGINLMHCLGAIRTAKHALNEWDDKQVYSDEQHSDYLSVLNALNKAWVAVSNLKNKYEKEGK